MTGEPRPSAEDPLIVTITAQLAAAPGVVGIALGGSRARARARADSDWDLALYVDDSFRVASVREIVWAESWSGHVAERGEWGPVMNGGAWLEIPEVGSSRRVDLMWRELSTLERLLDEADRGVFSVVRIPFFLAGMPTYVPVAELAFGRPLFGDVPAGRAMPVRLRERGSSWWRENAQLDFNYAVKLAARSEKAIAMGLLARVLVQLAHARMCDRGNWVFNEKGLVAEAGLDALASALTVQCELDQSIDALRTAIRDG